MKNVCKGFQSYLGAPAELKGIGSILSEVDVEAKQSTSSSQSLRKTLSADMLSQGWMCQENSLRKSCSFRELSRNSCSESEGISESESEDRSEEEDEDTFFMMEEEGKEADVPDKSCGDLSSLIQSEKKQALDSSSESEDRSEEEDGDTFSMTEEEGKEADVPNKNCGDLWSLNQSETKQASDSSFFALIAPVNNELKVDSSKWEPCKPYVHPAKIKSTLSDQSLRLCTESLGCESGTDCSYPSFSDTDDCSSASSEDNSSVFGEEEELEKEQESIPEENLKISDNVSGTEQEKEIKSRRSFPPPLSSIARTDGPCIHMRSYKRDGRLLLKAVQVESSQKYLSARREDGRLQLHFISTQQQELSPEEEKTTPAEHVEFTAQISKAEEKQLQQQQQQQFKSSSAFSNLSNLRRHILRSQYQNPSRNKEFPLNRDMNSTAKVKLRQLLKNAEVQGSNLTCSKEMNSFSKLPSASGFEDLVQERPSQSLTATPALLYYQLLKRNSPAGDFESKSLPKFPCNKIFRRCQVRQWFTKLGEPGCIAIS